MGFLFSGFVFFIFLVFFFIGFGFLVRFSEARFEVVFRCRSVWRFFLFGVFSEFVVYFCVVFIFLRIGIR